MKRKKGRISSRKPKKPRQRGDNDDDNIDDEHVDGDCNDGDDDDEDDEYFLPVIFHNLKKL